MGSPGSTPATERPQLHRTAVDDFWARLVSDDGAALLQRARSELRGRRLACHCVGREVVDDGGGRLPDACLPCHGHSLAAAANCTPRQLAQIAEAIHAQRSLTIPTADPTPDTLRHTISPQLQERDTDTVVTRGSRRANGSTGRRTPPSHARAREMPMMMALRPSPLIILSRGPRVRR